MQYGTELEKTYWAVVSERCWSMWQRAKISILEMNSKSEGGKQE